MAGQLFNGIPVPLLASAARTAAGQTATFKNSSTPFPVCQAAAIILDVTAVSGTSPTLDVFIETSVDNGTTWYPAYAFAQVTGVSTLRMDIRDIGIGITEVAAASTITSTSTSAITQNTVLTADVRLRWAVTATTPSFTFAVWGIFQPLGSQI